MHVFVCVDGCWCLSACCYVGFSVGLFFSFSPLTFLNVCSKGECFGDCVLLSPFGVKDMGSEMCHWTASYYSVFCITGWRNQRWCACNFVALHCPKWGYCHLTRHNWRAGLLECPVSHIRVFVSILILLDALTQTHKVLDVTFVGVSMADFCSFEGW